MLEKAWVSCKKRHFASQNEALHEEMECVAGRTEVLTRETSVLWGESGFDMEMAHGAYNGCSTLC